ncbi:MAG TPA: GNAT family N-acetyltransferase [Steroidobacteraceae bacterium]|nr:GNAT family N-acetyltransferase [Steroidobacteraceae bacterium]
MLRLRAAEAADVPEIFAMIGELADFERLRARMIGSADDLQRHLFGEPRFVAALLALWSGAVAGYALYFYNYSSFLCRPGLYLEDLYVRPAYRGRGIGRQLLQGLEDQARAQGCGRLEWAVLDWNRDAINFYHRFGAHANEGWTLFRKELA